MDVPAITKGRNGASNDVGQTESDRVSIKKALHSAIGNSLDDETLQAIQEMIEEMIEGRKNAVELVAREQRSLFKKIVEEKKKIVQGKATETKQEESIRPKNIKEKAGRAGNIEKLVVDREKMDQTPTLNDRDGATAPEEKTVEVLPPRDERAITMINDYLNKMPEALKVELTTLRDKSIFKVKLREPIDLINKLRSLPQVLSAEEAPGFGQKSIIISLSSVFV